MTLGRSHPSPDVLAHQQDALQTLEGLHIMWHNMELYELADLAILAYNTLTMLAGPAATEVADGVGLPRSLIGIGIAAGADVHRVEADMLTAAARIDRNATTALAPLVRAASFAIRDKLGTGVTLTLCQSVLSVPNTPEWDEMEPILQYVIEPHDQHLSILDVPEDSFIAAAQLILESLPTSTSVLAEQASDIVRSRAASIASRWIKDRVDQRLEAYRARLDGPPKDPLELDSLLTRWRERAWGASEPGPFEHASSAPLAYRRETRRTYAFVLSWLWGESDRPGDTLVEDSLRLLSHLDVAAERGEVVLATLIARRFERKVEAAAGSGHAAPAEAPVRPPGRSTASTSTSTRPTRVSFSSPSGGALPGRPASDSEALDLSVGILRDGIDAAAPSLWPATNWEIYRRLAQHDEPRRAEHLANADFWRAEDERVQQEPMFEDAARGRAFEVFWHHFQRVPELRLDSDPEQLAEILVGPPEEIWDPSNAIPDPLVYGSDGLPVALCCNFLRAGHYISHVAGQGDVPAVGEGLRDELHEAATARIEDLYRILIDPLPLREIFRRQRDRFLQV